MEQMNEETKISRRTRRQISDATNMKIEPKEVNTNVGNKNEQNEAVTRSLRKRKNVNYNEKKTSASPKANEEKIAAKSKIKSEQRAGEENKGAEDAANKQTLDLKSNIKQEISESQNAKSAKKIKVEKKADDQVEEKIITFTFNGDVPLDEKFVEIHGSSYKIYRESSLVYDCMLNQLIEKGSASQKQFYVWLRWGRVGKAGQFNLEPYGNDLNRAKDFFCKKFFDKTNNEFHEKDTFEKYPGKYDLVHKDYNASNDENSSANESNKQKEVVKQQEKVEIPPSKLDKRVQDLVELICSVTEMENTLKEMKYDAKKAPLGKLSKAQINAGYAALTQIDDLIKCKVSGRKLVEANNDFFTRIPHDFGMRTPPLLTTQSQIREKMKLLEILSDIEIAVKALNQKSEIINPIDRHYDQLECSIRTLDHDDEMFKLIETYLHKTHAPTHVNYKLKLVDVFETHKTDEEKRFNDLGNRMLLWHGSRTTNWASILMQGLRIAPPEAPSTGFMFGKGCYFADCSSKSANYCYTSSSKNIGLLSLSEVSLGVSNELKQADYEADKLPNGKNSTKGLGRSEPDKSEWITLANGCVIPCGKMKCNVGKAQMNEYALLYNEYVVYNLEQIKMKYLVKVEFEYED